MKKQKPNNQAELLALLKKVLPKATNDPLIATRILKEVENELRKNNQTESFSKFCDLVELPNLEPTTLMDVKRQFSDSFGNDANVKVEVVDEEEQLMAVEVELPDGDKLISQIKVRPNGPAVSEEPEVPIKFIPFPVALPGDPELVWILGKLETMNHEEAGISLAKVEEEFWASKQGQKLLRDRVERSFPEFVARVPSKMLVELGLKRHYKEPEAIKVLHPVPQAPGKPAAH